MSGLGLAWNWTQIVDTILVESAFETNEASQVISMFESILKSNVIVN